MYLDWWCSTVTSSVTVSRSVVRKSGSVHACGLIACPHDPSERSSHHGSSCTVTLNSSSWYSGEVALPPTCPQQHSAVVVGGTTQPKPLQESQAYGQPAVESVGAGDVCGGDHVGEARAGVLRAGAHIHVRPRRLRHQDPLSFMFQRWALRWALRRSRGSRQICRCGTAGRGASRCKRATASLPRPCSRT